MAYLNGNMNIMRFVTRESEAPRYKGIFPLPIDSVGGNLSDWTIYGNTEGVGERTKNLISVNNVTADTGITIVDADEATGSLKLSSSLQYRGGRFNFNFEDGKMYTISAVNNIATSNARIAFRQVGTNTIVSSVSLGTAGVKTVTLTFSSTDYPNGVYVSLICNMSADGVTRTIDLSNLMLVEGSSMLTDFIPYGYQIPLDIRSISETNEITKAYRADIIEAAGATIDVDRQTGTVTINGTTNNAVAEVIFYMNVTEGDYWYSGVPKQEDNSITAKLMNTHIRPPYEFNKWDGSEPGSDIGYGEEATVNASPVRYRLSFAPNHTFNNLVIKPKVQKATITTHKDIYTGSTPLTEGQSVSRDSTGIEIEVERGQSVIETTLTNKPEMDVVPDSYVKLKQIAMNSYGSYNETQIDYITDNIEEVTQ